MTITEQNFSKSVETRSVTWNPFTLLGQLSETRYWAYLLIIPSLILISAVVIYPILSGISLSFHMMRLNRPDLGMDYIGLEHYRKLLEDRTFRAALTNTLIWVVGGVARCCPTRVPPMPKPQRTSLPDMPPPLPSVQATVPDPVSYLCR